MGAAIEGEVDSAQGRVIDVGVFRVRNKAE